MKFKKIYIYTLLTAVAVTACAAVHQKDPGTADGTTGNQKLKQNTIVLSIADFQDKIRGGWAGQVIGCTFGGDTEFAYKGTFISDHQPILWWPGKILEYFKERPGLYDDIYMDLSFLEVLSEKGFSATPQQLAEKFSNAEYPLWHANQAARYNFLNGLQPPATGHWKNNPHADDIDFQIESEFIGLVAPGMLHSVAELGDRVGHIMNYGDGWYGGIYVASMVSLSFVHSDLEAIVETALETIPADSDFFRCIKDVIQWHEKYPDDWKMTWFEIQKKWAHDIGCPGGVFHPFNIDAKLNAAYVVTGLLYGQGDFEKTMEIATRSGQDSDCNPATAAGILGVIEGYSNLPRKYIADIERIEDFSFKYTNMSLKDAYKQTYEIAVGVIREHGGEIDGGNVTINLQEPRSVRYEKGWEGLYPAKRIWVDKKLDKDVALEMNGTGVVVIGWAYKTDENSPDTDLHVKVTIDGEDAETVRLPTNERYRKQEIYWSYDLTNAEHEIELKWLNPSNHYGIRIREMVTYTDQPYHFDHR